MVLRFCDQFYLSEKKVMVNGMDLLSHSLSPWQKKERKKEVTVFSQQTSWQVGAEKSTGVINNL